MTTRPALRGQPPRDRSRWLGCWRQENGGAWRLSRGPERRCPFWLWRVWARWAWGPLPLPVVPTAGS